MLASNLRPVKARFSGWSIQVLPPAVPLSLGSELVEFVCVASDPAVTAVEQISLWLHLEGVVRPGTTCDPRSYAESWGLRRKSRLGGLEYDFCFPPHLVLFLDFLHLETNTADYCLILRTGKSATGAVGNLFKEFNGTCRTGSRNRARRVRRRHFVLSRSAIHALEWHSGDPRARPKRRLTAERWRRGRSSIWTHLLPFHPQPRSAVLYCDT
jgi:hypothetical protein